MSYVKSSLRKNEQVLHSGTLSWFTVIYPLIWAFIVDVLATLTGAFNSPFIVYILVLVSIYKLIVRLTSEFAVTNQRVIIKNGLIFRNTFDLAIQKIEGCMLKQSILGRIFRYGDIIVQGTGSTKYKVNTLSQPFKFRNFICDAIEERK